VRLFVGIVLLLFGSVIVACAPVNTRLMYHPKTGDVKECKRDPWKNWVWEEEAVLKRCSDEYRKLGYVDTDEATIKTQSSKSALTEKLLDLKSAKEKGLITEKEYEAQRSILIRRFSEGKENNSPQNKVKPPVR
jgi:hypothetical protein